MADEDTIEVAILFSADPVDVVLRDDPKGTEGSQTRIEGRQAKRLMDIMRDSRTALAPNPVSDALTWKLG